MNEVDNKESIVPSFERAISVVVNVDVEIQEAFLYLDVSIKDVEILGIEEVL